MPFKIDPSKISWHSEWSEMAYISILSQFDNLTNQFDEEYRRPMDAIFSHEFPEQSWLTWTQFPSLFFTSQI